MNKLARPIALGLFLLFAPVQLLQANVAVNFVEGAPKDRFVIKNTGACTLSDIKLTIDLSTSEGGLIFDTSEKGAGVEVFQPFEVRQGNIQLTSAATVNDGDTVLSIRIPELGSGRTVSFTIDVDDTLVNSSLGQIRVADAEIAKTTLKLVLDENKPVSAVFGGDSSATVLLPSCPV